MFLSSCNPNPKAVFFLSTLNLANLFMTLSHVENGFIKVIYYEMWKGPLKKSDDIVKPEIF